MEILGKILGSQARVRMMRLFLLNRSKGFSSKDIAKRSRVSREVVHRELDLLSNIGFIKRRATSWFFDSSFKYASEIDNLLINADTLDKAVIIDNFKKVGRVKLIIISGIFIKDKQSRVDLLIVGNKIRKSKIEESVHRLEAEIGAELVYAVFDTKEFTYRLNSYENLIRDILAFPPEVVLQAKELSTKVLKRPRI